MSDGNPDALSQSPCKTCSRTLASHTSGDLMRCELDRLRTENAALRKVADIAKGCRALGPCYSHLWTALGQALADLDTLDSRKEE